MSTPAERLASVPPRTAPRRDAPVPLVMLHGLFGDADNLRGLGARLGAERAIHRLELPGHGDRPATDPLDQASMARAVARDIVALVGPDAPVHLLGHSLGGKVAMTLAGLAARTARTARAPSPGTIGGPEAGDAPMLASLTVLDIAPKAYPPHHARLIDALRGLDLHALGTRRDADAALAAAIPNAGVRAFLLKGLARARDADGGGAPFRWRFDVERIARDYPHLSAAPPAAPPTDLPALFLHGGDGDYVDPAADAPGIAARFPRATLESVPGTGHWLHAERPDAVAAACARHLAVVEASGAGAPPTNRA